MADRQVRQRVEEKDDGKGDKDGKGRKIYCGVCTEALEADDTGIHCQNAHHMCAECSADFVQSSLKEGPAAFPPKCAFCAVKINVPSFERQLTEEQNGTYLSYMLMAQLPEGEVMVECPFASCSYVETRYLGENGSRAEINFVHCQNPACGKVSCGLCKKECVPCSGSDGGGGDDSDEDDGIDAVQRGMMKHFKCAENEHAFGAARKAFEKAIEASTQFPCPTCGLTGMKDDACTHMKCSGCNAMWCYVCGLDTASSACSKATSRGRPEYAHNVNWHTKPDRCPMYLGEINQVDTSYPEDDDAALLMLHRQRALRLLRAEYDKIGRSGYLRLSEAFPTVGPASGFSEEQILSVEANQALFNRSNIEDFEE